MWQALVASVVIFLAPFLVLLSQHPIPPQGWIWIALTGLLHTFYFRTLAAAYRRADLSVAYPIARGLGPALVLVLAVGVLGESVSPLGVAGILAVVLGIYAINIRPNQPGSWLGPNPCPRPTRGPLRRRHRRDHRRLHPDRQPGRFRLCIRLSTSTSCTPYPLSECL